MLYQNIQREIKELLKVKTDTPSVLSVYLDMSGTNESTRKEVQVFLKNAFSQEKTRFKNDLASLENLEASHKELLKYLEEELEPHFKGLAIFIAANIPIIVPFKSMVPFKNEYLFAKSPYLKQLIELSDDFEPTLLVSVDSREAKIYKIVFGGFFSKEAFTNKTPGRYAMGGLNDMKWQHHFDFHLKEHAKSVADQIIKLVDQEGYSSIILTGQSRNLGFLKEGLPKRLLDKISFENTLDRSVNDQEVVNKIIDQIKRHEKESEKSVVENLITVAKSEGNGGVTGIRKTIDACNKGLIRKLVVSENLAQNGFSCPKCKSIFDSFQMTCTLCGIPLEEMDLGYALMIRSKELDGDVEVIHGKTDLDKRGSVGAFLR